MRIENNTDLKNIFKKNKRPIFGASVYAFERVGPEKLFDNYKLLSLHDSQETDLIKKDIPVFCLEQEIGKKISPRNSSSLLCHKKTKEYLDKESKGLKPLILIYKSSKRIAQIAKKNNWEIAISPSFFGKRFLEDKAKFRRILQKVKVGPPPGRIVSLSFFAYRKLSEIQNEFGDFFVIQHPAKGGGKGTFFIKNSKDFNAAKQYLRRQKTEEIIITKLINGPSPSLTGCVTRKGILSTRPQYQICDVSLLNKKPKRGGLFCGNDWSSANFSKNVLSQAKEAVDKIGNYFKKIGYIGIFGLDFVLDEKEEKLYVVECNPRLLATFPTLTMVQIENGETPIIAFHLLEYLKSSYQVDVKKINEQMWRKKEGAQMFLHNPIKKRAIQNKEFKAGIYKKGNSNKLTFLKETYKFSDLKGKEQFLFTDGIQKRGSFLKGYQRIRILTKKGVLGDDFRGVDKRTKEFLETGVGEFKKSLKKI